MERVNVREIGVLLVAEPTASACGCAKPIIHWSDTYGYGHSVRRFYFFCANCATFGFVAIPGATWGEASIIPDVSKKMLLERAESTLDGLPDLPEMLGIFRRVADGVFDRRSRCAEFHLDTIKAAIEDEALGLIRRRAEDAARTHAAWMADAAAIQSRLLGELEQRVGERRRRSVLASERALSRRKPAPDGEFPLLARGRDNHGVTIYGLIDPREPNRIRYVGQAQRPANRLAGHIAGAARERTKKDQWIRELGEQGLYPDMVLLERTRPDANPDTLERWWIAQMVAKGQADLNTASVPKPPDEPAADASPARLKAEGTHL